jgi:putative ABC transport system ATP-binding protein
MAKLARQQGSGVVIVTHDHRIMDVADRVLYLSDGSLVDEVVQLQGQQEGESDDSATGRLCRAK